MRKDVEAQEARGERIGLFAQNNPDLFTLAAAAAALAVVNAQTNRLKALTSGQQTGLNLSTGARGSKKTILSKMMLDLRATRRTFDQLKKKDHTITGNLNLPPDQKEGSIVGAVTAAIGLVSPLLQKFLDRGKKTDFLGNMQNDLALYNQLVSEQQTGTGDRQTAVNEIEDAVEKLIEAIADLDDIMENQLDEPDEQIKLGEWKRASKLGTIIRNPGNATPPPATA